MGGEEGEAAMHRKAVGCWKSGTGNPGKKDSFGPMLTLWGGGSSSSSKTVCHIAPRVPRSLRPDRALSFPEAPRRPLRLPRCPGPCPSIAPVADVSLRAL